MPRDILSDSLAVLRIVEHDDEENWPLEDKPSCKPGKKSGDSDLNSVQSYTKDDCACYYNYALGEGVNNRQQDPIYQYKTSSLPAASTMPQSWDDVICSALRISPEDIANQLTLLDLPCFKGIRPDELTTCGWNKLNKLTVAPNVVAFTKRFNRVSFWTVQEILNGQSPKSRAETLAHFIKVGKKLHELNNLHSLFAIISALQSASIYRLSKTWASLSKKDKLQFDKLAELFGEKDNWTALRQYLRSISLPCIPYLGIFLTDLVYIDIAHPAGSPHRIAKMAVVLKTLERYQSSEYDIAPLPNVANYLNSVRYIEELQKFLEDDQYKLSLKLEPPSPIGSCASSKESIKEVGPPGGSTPYSLSPSHRLGSGSLRIHGTYNQSKFIPTHRKCRSLGSNIFGKSHTDEKMEEKTPAGSVNLLDDTLLESPTAVPHQKMSISLPQSELSKSIGSDCDYQGFVRRKTVMKEGRKPALSSWQRYWLQISGNVLTFYASKSFKGCGGGGLPSPPLPPQMFGTDGNRASSAQIYPENICAKFHALVTSRIVTVVRLACNRIDFRTERCKLLALDGWTAVWNDSDSDVFQLVNHHSGTLYKFKTGSDTTAKQWVSKIDHVTNKAVKPLPANLMSFE